MCRSTAPHTRSPGSVDVNEEGPNFSGDCDVLKEKVGSGVVTSGGCISRILCARDIFCVYSPILMFCKVKDMAEYLVGGSLVLNLFHHPSTTPLLSP